MTCMPSMILAITMNMILIEVMVSGDDDDDDDDGDDDDDDDVEFDTYHNITGNHLPNTTCLTQVFFKRDEYCSNL